MVAIAAVIVFVIGLVIHFTGDDTGVFGVWFWLLLGLALLAFHESGWRRGPG